MLLVHKETNKIAKHHKFARTLYYFIIMTILFLIFFIVHTDNDYYFKTNYTQAYYQKAAYIIKKVNIQDKNQHTPEMKYVLIWTKHHESPISYLGKGTSLFKNKSCRWQNCFITSDRNYLGDYSEFEVILFNGPRLPEILFYYDIPKKRFLNQKYVFATIESSNNYPICVDTWNEFFNWTWTYKLDSDSVWGYFVIKNAAGHVIGPSTEMHWISQFAMEDIDMELKTKLKSKKKLAAWFVSNCNTLSLREVFVKEIEQELSKFKLNIDIYGNCGKHQCPRDIMSRCLDLLERDYYFYLAFENSLSVDYVTEKVLYALKHNTVPIVYGGANYSRFLPPGSYINARELGTTRLAKIMYELINNPAAYHKFFRWKKYYSYHYRHESPETDDYCRFCAMINNETLMATTSVYDNFSVWWSGDELACLRNFTV